MAYLIEQHTHRLAAWAASTAASASPLCRFKVQQGVAILEAGGFTPSLSPDGLPAPDVIDKAHKQWCGKVIKAARAEGLDFTHGVAAKLLNTYLKVRFVCGGYHDRESVKALHPPIDEVLLIELARRNLGGHATRWRALRNARWSRFDGATYQSAINLVRDSLPPGEPLWKVEEHWQGHQ
jgi:hypothetical protein